MKYIKLITTAIVMALSQTVLADYPIFYQRYTADPYAVVYNGRLYIYCSHDTYDVKRGYGYFMNDITCISTCDMKNWTDHGEVFKASDSKWGAKQSWAPCVIRRNGLFYMYYGNANGGGIGVATSKDPTGPFIDNHDHPVVGLDTPGVSPGSGTWGMWCFDPGIIVDDKNQAYLYFGGGDPANSRIIKLKDNMYESEGTAVHPNTPGFFEASFVHRYNGKYYYSYAGHHFSYPANIEYVMSDKPMSGFGEPGLILPNPPDNDGFNNHHSIVCFKGHWYIVYHNRTLAIENGETDKRAREYMRSVAIDQLFYNPNGTIRKVEITRDGLKQLLTVNPYVCNEAETMAREKGINTKQIKTGNNNRAVCSISNGDYTEVRGVNFGNRGASTFTVCLNSTITDGAVEARLDSLKGPAIAVAAFKADEHAGHWQQVKSKSKNVRGTHNVYFVFRCTKDDDFLFDSWRFSK
jgi:arabinoxylan arabinofuranohydrolase